MAYNNGFPATYQYYMPQYQPVMQQPQQPQPAQNGGMIWVSGEAGAKAYLVAPNTTVQLWDSEAQVVYLKSADASGMPSMKILDYTIRDQMPANAPVAAPNTQVMDLSSYATRADVDALAGRLEALRAELDSMTAKRTTRKEAASNE